MLDFCKWDEDTIRVSTKGDRYNLSWAEFNLSGELVQECERSAFMPGLTESEIQEATEMIKRFKPAPFENVYLRFNDLPVGGKSRNHASGKLEDGVSCYNLVWDLVSGSYKRHGGLDGAMICYALQGAPMYLVTGTEVGVGSDGEPLIKDAVIVASAVFDAEREGYIVG